MKNIVITGGTSGVGFSIATEIVKEGHNIIIVGRHEYKAHIAQKKLGNNVKVAIPLKFRFDNFVAYFRCHL